MNRISSKEFVRDNGSNALISTDVRALEAVKSQRDKALKLNSLQQEVQNLKTDITEIKSLLVKLIDGK